MLGKEFILNILQKSLSVLGSIACLVHRMKIHSFFPLSKGSPLPKKIADMCRNEKHARRWRHIKGVFGQLLSTKLHSEEQVFLPWGLLLSQRSDHTVHMIEHLIVHCNIVMQVGCMPL